MLKANSRSFTLRDLVAPLFRRKRVLIITFLFVFAATALLGLLRLHKYESHMAILVSHEPDPLVSTEATDQSSATPAVTSQEIKSEAELLKSRDLLEPVVLANGLQNLPGTLLNALRPRPTQAERMTRAVRALASQLDVETPFRTNLIEVTYRSSDPSLAYGVLNSLSNLYLERHAAGRRQTSKAVLEDAEAGLRAAGQPQVVSVPNAERAGLAAQLTAAVGQSHTIEQAIAADEQRIQSDQEQMKATQQSLATKQDTQDATLLLRNLGASLMKRAQLLQKYEPSDPRVQAADREIAKAKAAIVQADKRPNGNQTTDRDPALQRSRQNLAEDEADLAGERASLAANRHGIENLKSQMVKPGGQSLDEADLEREAKADEQNYLLYLSKREQERASGRTRIVNVAIATPPAIPVLPAHNLAFIFLAAFALATLVSFPAAYIIDYFDPSFHTPAQVVDMLGVPVVVSVPKWTG